MSDADVISGFSSLMENCRTLPTVEELFRTLPNESTVHLEALHTIIERMEMFAEELVDHYQANWPSLIDSGKVVEMLSHLDDLDNEYRNEEIRLTQITEHPE
jgi:hypothetical protein